MCEFLKKLQEPFKANEIEWRVQQVKATRNGKKAIVLPYVTSRAIQDRLDDVFGIAGWKNEYHEWRGNGVLCTISCKVGDEWISKSDGADTTNIEATKGGFSASMKRTAVQWGVGRYLYKLDQQWMNIESSGDNFVNSKVKINGKDEWVKGYWNTPLLPQWALPEGETNAKGITVQEDLSDPNESDLPTPPPAETEKPRQSSQQTNQQSSEPNVFQVKKSIFQLREELGWQWNDLSEFASTLLNKEIKFIKKDLQTMDECMELKNEMLKVKDNISA